MNIIPTIDPLRITTIEVVKKQTIEININIPIMHSKFVVHITVHFKIARNVAVARATALIPDKA